MEEPNEANAVDDRVLCQLQVAILYLYCCITETQDKLKGPIKSDTSKLDGSLKFHKLGVPFKTIFVKAQFSSWYGLMLDLHIRSKNVGSPLV